MNGIWGWKGNFLRQWSWNFSVHQNSLGNLNHRLLHLTSPPLALLEFLIPWGLKSGPRIYISSKFLSDADDAGLGTALVRTTARRKLNSLPYTPGRRGLPCDHHSCPGHSLNPADTEHSGHLAVLTTWVFWSLGFGFYQHIGKYPLSLATWFS